MTEITIENIIAYTKIANKLNIEKIAEKLPDFKYNPNEFAGLTLKLEKPNAAVLLLPNGKVICTGAKNFEGVETAIKSAIEKIKNIQKKLIKKPKIETQNIITSIELKKELNLSLISKESMLENIDYEPDKFPGLIYRMDDVGASFLIFSSGKIICTGVKTIEEVTNAIKMMEEKLSSLGVI